MALRRLQRCREARGRVGATLLRSCARELAACAHACVQGLLPGARARRGGRQQPRWVRVQVDGEEPRACQSRLCSLQPRAASCDVYGLRSRVNTEKGNPRQRRGVQRAARELGGSVGPRGCMQQGPQRRHTAAACDVSQKRRRGGFVIAHAAKGRASFYKRVCFECRASATSVTSGLSISGASSTSQIKLRDQTKGPGHLKSGGRPPWFW